jgi:uncharacterized sulfatase
MNRLWIALFTSVFIWTSAFPCAANDRPNILFILTDDQGWPTLGCYGNKHVATPHLDRLAGQGVRFTDAYVTPQCTPTRASLLSGQHTARNGMWHVIGWYGSPWARVSEPAFREQFPRDMPNLPKALRAAGYATGMAGKWHLTNGPEGNYISLHPNAASAYGFDFVAPTGEGNVNQGDKWVDHLTDETIRFIRKHRERTWFFYLAHHTLHGEVSAPERLVAKHRAAGAPEAGLQNATYLAAIEHLDDSIGRLMAALDEMQLTENTLVVFLSDNGGVDASYALPGWNDEPLDGSRPLAIRKEEFDNAPLRFGKGSPYEGGIRVPCLVRWPQRIAAGQVEETPIHIVDWMPTLLAATGAPAPEGHTLDGVDLGPLMQGESIPDRPLFWYMPLYDLRWAATPCAVMREGDWKLIEYFGDHFDAEGRYHAGPHLELFHLGRDLGETTNLAKREPERSSQMRTAIHTWLKNIPAPIPGKNPHFQRDRMLEETREKQPWNPAEFRTAVD